MSEYLRLNVRDAVKVGGLTLPGVVTSLTVDGSLEVIQDKLEGSSEHLTAVGGYTTATVRIEITILGTDSERERQLRIINTAFMVNPPSGQVEGAKAMSMRVVNPHLDARRIRNMLFDGFSSRDGSEDDSTVATLTFREILSEQARLEKAAKEASESGGSGEATDPTAGPAELPGVSSSTEGPQGGGPDAKPPGFLDDFLKGYKAGKDYVEFDNPQAVDESKFIYDLIAKNPEGMTREVAENAFNFWPADKPKTITTAKEYIDKMLADNVLKTVSTSGGTPRLVVNPPEKWKQKDAIVAIAKAPPAAPTK